ncbi:hypothetical protein QOT17_010877 [Balamuthia mandrillaris]
MGMMTRRHHSISNAVSVIQVYGKVMHVKAVNTKRIGNSGSKKTTFASMAKLNTLTTKACLIPRLTLPMLRSQLMIDFTIVSPADARGTAIHGRYMMQDATPNGAPRRLTLPLNEPGDLRIPTAIAPFKAANYVVLYHSS